ncbi:hypothetical protein KFL_005660100 [Klebsormidium nitens]|uniref:Uncharacterized protein n=1 Tax=Klebsormidium nitens TaxID=105231 RepID=A0A1Y1IM12_KLENI|nr:hypothetical protein KFL_005660100 [Klebsormidium nitens]|eukprot:GAQ89826.1 hypothetical protein KFL_005660100 [Klebsormidium nitens]
MATVPRQPCQQLTNRAYHQQPLQCKNLCKPVFVPGAMASPAALRLMALSALLLLCAPTTFASVTPQQLVANIQSITVKGQALQNPAQSISLINGPLIVVGLGPYPIIINGFNDIVATLTHILAGAQGTKSFSDSDAKPVADAFRELVRMHQILLNILTGKAGLFSTTSIIIEPVAVALRSYEGIIDSLAFTLMDIASAEAKTIEANKNGLDGTIAAAIKAHTPGPYVQ